MPHLAALAREMGPRADFAVVYIAEAHGACP